MSRFLTAACTKFTSSGPVRPTIHSSDFAKEVMKVTFAVFALFVVCANAATLPQTLIQGSVAPLAINEGLINEVNSKATTWKAGRNEFLEGKTVEDVKRLLGTQLEDIPAHIPRVSHKDVSDIPSDFDSRTQWPNCIGPVLNQGDCGSCWGSYGKF